MTILWSGPPTRRLLPEAALVGVVYFWNWGHHPKSTASQSRCGAGELKSRLEHMCGILLPKGKPRK